MFVGTVPQHVKSIIFPKYMNKNSKKEKCTCKNMESFQWKCSRLTYDCERIIRIGTGGANAYEEEYGTGGWAVASTC